MYHLRHTRHKRTRELPQDECLLLSGYEGLCVAIIRQAVEDLSAPRADIRQDAEQFFAGQGVEFFLAPFNLDAAFIRRRLSNR